MSHARIEEVEDSDVSDPSEADIGDFDDADIVRRIAEVPRQAKPNASSSSVAASLPAASSFSEPRTAPYQSAGHPGAYAGYRCIYPVYFDSTRSRAEGRRVGRDLAVSNPLAAEIAAACQRLGLNPVLEATKIHPKDWANPGRVRVLLKEGDVEDAGGKGKGGKAGNPGPGAGRIKNKHHLYNLISQHLRENPTTEKSQALWMRLPGAPLPDADKPYPRPAPPRGWKMGELLPYYSPAMTGGGVSENFFKDMMKEMQGGGDMASMLAGAGGGTGEEKKKKDKKGKGKS